MQVVIRLKRDPDLVLVIATIGLTCRFTGELNSRQQQRDEDPDDGDDDQQFHQREPRATPPTPASIDRQSTKAIRRGVPEPAAAPVETVGKHVSDHLGYGLVTIGFPRVGVV